MALCVCLRTVHSKHICSVVQPVCHTSDKDIIYFLTVFYHLKVCLYIYIVDILMVQYVYVFINLRFLTFLCMWCAVCMKISVCGCVCL